ncbi:hypothetical protein FHS18_003928 [Paenibacillus phyllosphaerae]|uniref:DUF3500 domain-containing protein n=1 Tax=Paenibacillus phyllosphaerae TaxID=274593 RepID=A0A7W5AZX7_9BACL|nr:DUF3500 domain-containing protein [Paenibacillus phyllosphaerae]MBB3111860.1 hypothetical protein [Paenibacillus phyllosphaerae]
MKKLSLTLVSLLVLVSLVLSACGNENTTDTNDSTTNTTDTANTEGTETTDQAPSGTEGPPDGGGPGGGGPGGGVTIPESVTDVAATMTKDTALPDVSACSTGTAAAQVACLAQAFKATLTEEQISTLQYDMTADNAKVWSNLPINTTQRNGIMIGTLSAESLEAFKALAYGALGQTGYETFRQLLYADEFLSASNSSMWDSNYYYVSFLGEPSDSSAWILQIGGHHYASNISYNAKATSSTPMFVGVEPLSFTAADGATYTPLAVRHDTMYDMLQSLSDEQTEAAKLSKTFDDVLVGPGKDSAFPTESEGVAVSELSADQQALVKKAIEAWVNDTQSDIANELLDVYLSTESLGQTNIAWSGSTELNTHASYVRIDGPRVWIEFVCQNGIAFPNEIHYHTIWRDKVADYGGSFSS